MNKLLLQASKYQGLSASRNMRIFGWRIKTAKSANRKISVTARRLTSSHCKSNECLNVDISSHVRVYPAAIRLYLAAIRPFQAVSGHFWLYPAAIRLYQAAIRPFQVVSGHFWPYPAAIRLYQAAIWLYLVAIRLYPTIFRLSGCYPAFLKIFIHPFF